MVDLTGWTASGIDQRPVRRRRRERVLHRHLVTETEDSTPPLIVHPITAAEVLVAPVRRGIAEQVWADLVAIGVEVDGAPIDPLRLARLRAETGGRMPDCCVIASVATYRTTAATFDDRLRRAGLT